MKKQLVLVCAGAVVVFVLFFGRTTAIKKPVAADNTNITIQSFSIQQSISAAKKTLTPSQLSHLTKIENNIRPDKVASQQIQAYTELANFWKDSTKKCRSLSLLYC
ncbi:MAG: hypothetical protein IPJ81_02735 [Chitinophagaceae bacterium]|nr:hypothetical protein [Chitinophagaceae bacterium]